MNSEFQKRLYEMEVIPPAGVWEKLSVNIDEINADNSIAKKVYNAELTPPAAAWENISIALGTEEKKEPVKRGVIINFRRLAAAALFIGVIVTAWIVFRNNNGNDTLAEAQNGKETKPATDSNSNNEKKVENIQQPDILPGTIEFMQHLKQQMFNTHHLIVKLLAEIVLVNLLTIFLWLHQIKIILLW